MNREVDIYENLSLIRRRVQRTFFVFILVFLFLVLYFWKIQVLDYREFWKKSEDNRIRESVVPPQRGLVYSRNGALLARNIGSFKAFIVRENCEDLEKSCGEAARLLQLETEVIKERMQKYASSPDFVPIMVKEDLKHSEVAVIEGRKMEMPELIVQAEPKRHYPQGTLAAHVLGYLLEISTEELRSERYPGRRIGDLIGNTGIEKQYEEVLYGKEGRRLEVVDSMGRSQGVLAEQASVPGQNIWLTIDDEIQGRAEELLSGREGAVVVMHPKTGEILALASYPTYDPNKFINRFTPEEWMELVDSPEFPLENRTIRGMYAPGSIFKLVMALAALDAKIISDRTSFICSGSVVIYNHPFRCWYGPGHGAVNLYGGLEHSCNVFFYQIGRRMDIDDIARYARMFGFGQDAGIDLPGGKVGLVPDRKWKREVRNAPWYPGETISVSIGQGPLLVSPLQIAVFTSLIATRGKKIIPHLLLGFGKEDPSNGFESREDGAIIEIDRSQFDKVKRGMWMAVNDTGTARLAMVPGFDVCGKTGSTQVVGTEVAEKLAKQKKIIKTHSWFTGFAPRDDPDVVVTVLVEYGGGGGETAAPLAKRLFELFRMKYDR